LSLSIEERCGSWVRKEVIKSLGYLKGRQGSARKTWKAFYLAGGRIAPIPYVFGVVPLL